MGKTRPKICTIGWDPGRINCAYAVYDGDKLKETDVIEGTVDDVLNLQEFGVRVARVLDWFEPNLCGVERYQLRGRGKGFIGNMEQVNLMIGVIFEQCRQRGIPCRLVTPSAHKTWAKKFNGAIKGKKKKIDIHTCPEFKHLDTDHEADAANIAKYTLTKFMEEQ